jgi:hypothetical protein
MILVAQTLSGSLEQRVMLRHTKRYVIGSIIPYLLMVNAPSGNFVFKVLKDSLEIFSHTFPSANNKTSLGITDNFAHVYFPIVPDDLQLEQGEYVFRLESDYSPTFTSFLAWIQQHEDIQNEIDYTPSGDQENPLTVRLKILRKGII